jgi:hypothetical protein
MTIYWLNIVYTSIYFLREVVVWLKYKYESLIVSKIMSEELLRIILFAILALLSFISVEFIYYSAAAEPIIDDPNLKVEIVFEGIGFPTSMAFVDQDDILVLEKNNGIVRRIVNGVSLSEPLLDVNVSNANERGMLGIAVAKNYDENTTNVFFYYT